MLGLQAAIVRLSVAALLTLRSQDGRICNLSY